MQVVSPLTSSLWTLLEHTVAWWQYENISVTYCFGPFPAAFVQNQVISQFSSSVLHHLVAWQLFPQLVVHHPPTTRPFQWNSNSTHTRRERWMHQYGINAMVPRAIHSSNCTSFRKLTSTKQGQQISGQHDGTQVIGPLPRLHIPKQNLESIRTCSPLPPQQNVLKLLHLRVASRTWSKCSSSKYKTVTLSLTDNSQHEAPHQGPLALAACIVGLLNSRLFSLTYI